MKVLNSYEKVFSNDNGSGISKDCDVCKKQVWH